MSSSKFEEDNPFLTEDEYEAWVEKNESRFLKSQAEGAVASEAVAAEGAVASEAAEAVAAEVQEVSLENLLEKKYMITLELDSSYILSDIKKNILILLNSKTYENRLFIRNILNIQLFLLNNEKYYTSYTDRNPNYWLISDDGFNNSIYLFNLLSILFNVKTYLIINKMLQLIKDPIRSSQQYIDIIYDYRYYIEKETRVEEITTDDILKNIIVKDGEPEENVYKLRFMNFQNLNTIKSTAIKEFIDALILFNNDILRYSDIVLDKRHNQILFDLLSELHINQDYITKIDILNKQKIESESMKTKKEIDDIIYNLIQLRETKILEYDLMNKLSKYNYISGKLFFIKNKLQNIKNPFLLMVNELKKKSEMVGYIEFIKHILYQINYYIRYDIIGEIKDFFKIFIIDDELIKYIKKLKKEENFNVNKLMFYNFKTFNDFNTNIDKIIQDLLDFTKQEKYKNYNDIFKDKNYVDILLLPTDKIIAYCENILLNIYDHILFYNEKKFFQHDCISEIIMYLNHCNRMKKVVAPNDYFQDQSSRV